MTDFDSDPNVIAFRQRMGNLGLVRFAAGWGIVLGIVALFTPMFALGIIGLVVCIPTVLLITSALKRMRLILAQAMFETPEFQQALREEAGRRLRDGDY